MTRGTRYPAELRERAVRLVLEHEGEYPSQWAALTSIAAKCGMTPETLRKWVRRAEVDAGARPGLTTDERSASGAGAREPRTAPGQRDPQVGCRFFRAGARPATAEMTRYIDAYRARFGVEPICRTLQVAPSTYYAARMPAALGTLSARRGAEAEAQAGPRPALRRLRRPQALAPAAARRHARSPAAPWSG